MYCVPFARYNKQIKCFQVFFSINTSTYNYNKYHTCQVKMCTVIYNCQLPINCTCQKCVHLYTIDHKWYVSNMSTIIYNWLEMENVINIQYIQLISLNETQAAEHNEFKTTSLFCVSLALLNVLVTLIQH